MLKLIIGLKGSGKTKNLIAQVNDALARTAGNVVVIEQGEKLRYDVKYTARLINTLEYGVATGEAFYGLVAGIVASNSDVTDIFVDGSIRICGTLEALEAVLPALDELSRANDVNLVMTCSVAADAADETVKKYV